VLDYLREIFGDEAPPAELDWAEEDTTSSGVTGSTTVQYRAEGWMLELGYPMSAPDAVVYEVMLFGRDGFYWEGKVDTSGQVMETTVNPVEEANLHSTVKLEVLELDLASDSPDAGGYVQRLIIEDATLLDEIVGALDTELSVAPKLACIPIYTLRFQLEDGTVHEFGYSCQDASFIRGEQEFWQGKDYRPPEGFESLLDQQLATTLPSTVNVTQQARLAETVAIEVYETIISEVTDTPGVAEAHVEQRLTITNLDVIGEIVASLDEELPLGPRARMPAPFSLQFRLQDGSVQLLGYAPGGEQPGILRGDQGFFGGQDAQPPSVFELLMFGLPQ
jgi:hypothetical protein